jgi:hypothetical protein
MIGFALPQIFSTWAPAWDRNNRKAGCYWLQTRVGTISSLTFATPGGVLNQPVWQQNYVQPPAGHLSQADLNRYLDAMGANHAGLALLLRTHLAQTVDTVPSLAQIQAALNRAGLRLVPVDAKP